MHKVPSFPAATSTPTPASPLSATLANPPLLPASHQHGIGASPRKSESGMPCGAVATNVGGGWQTGQVVCGLPGHPRGYEEARPRAVE